MDESLSQAMNFINENKSSESSSVLEPWQIKTEMSDDSDDIFIIPVPPRACSTELVKKDYPVPFAQRPLKPFRKRITREEIAFNRECKKLELVWTNRDLPIDRQSLCSAANKDAFDLRDLSKSLPSSTSEKKIRTMQMILQQRPESYSSQLQQPKNLKTKSLYLSDKSSASETKPLVRSRKFNCSMNEGSVKLSLMRAQKLCRFERMYSQILAELEKDSNSYKQNETSNERKNLNMGKAGRSWVEDCEFTFPDVEQKEEKQDSGAQNKEKSIEMSPMPKHQDMGQCFSQDSEKKWGTDFQDVRVPLNSPNKGNATNDDPFLAMQKVLEKTRQCSVRLMRAQRRLRELNSLRGEIPESMDESESEMPSAEQASGRHSAEHPTYMGLRSIYATFAVNSAKSDEILPD